MKVNHKLELSNISVKITSFLSLQIPNTVIPLIESQARICNPDMAEVTNVAEMALSVTIVERVPALNEM